MPFNEMMAQKMLSARPSFQSRGSPQVNIPPSYEGGADLGAALGKGASVAIQRWMESREKKRDEAFTQAQRIHENWQVMPAGQRETWAMNMLIQDEFTKARGVRPDLFEEREMSDAEGKKRKYVFPTVLAPTEEVAGRQLRATKEIGAGKGKPTAKVAEATSVQKYRAAATKEVESRTVTLDLANEVETRVVGLREQAVLLGNKKLIAEYDSILQNIKESRQRVRESQKLLPGKLIAQETAQATGAQQITASQASVEAVLGEEQRAEEKFPLTKDYLKAQIFATYQNVVSKSSAANLAYKKEYNVDKILHDSFDTEVKALRDQYAGMPHGQPVKYTAGVISQAKIIADVKGFVAVPVGETAMAISGGIVDNLARQKVNIALENGYNMFKELGYGNIKDKEAIFAEVYKFFISTYGTLLADELDKDGKPTGRKTSEFLDPSLEVYMYRPALLQLQLMQEELSPTSRATQQDLYGGM